MRQVIRCIGGFVLAATFTACIPALRADEVKSPGTGPSYDLIGKVAVMHQGRVKPFDTVAREEVKEVYSRETIKLADLREEIAKILDDPAASRKEAPKSTVEKWGPVGAFLGWTVNPEIWDDKSFILVDYLPLRRLIMAEERTNRLKAIAAKSTTPDAEKAQLEKLAGDEAVTAAAITAFVRSSKLPDQDRRTIAELATKLTEEHKWLTPRELESAQIRVKGQPVSFLEWASELQDQQRRYNANPQSAQRLTEVERRAVEVATRLMTYKAYSGEQLRTSDVVLIMPRPSSAQYLADTAKSIKEAREKSTRDMPLWKLDELKAVSTFWNDIPRDDRHDPTEDSAFDKRYCDWLRDNSVWVPLKVLLKAKPEELVAGGYSDGALRGFLAAYHEMEQAEISAPGQVSSAIASKFLSATRSLGESVNPTKYPTVAMIDRETHFNATNPFWQAPYAYGAALAFLAISLGFVKVTGGKSFSEILGSTIYRVGLCALGIGICLEIYGFYLRVGISGWAPVTNMYETVIWVALVSAVLSFVFELIYRKVFMALAGSAVALLGTITAANVPLLDPGIKSLQPVLRSNLWLTIHVLTEVSSYAAFGLAWGLGLIACLYYLTATYRRSPKFRELALLLIPGIPVLAVGGVGVAASYGLFGPQWSITDSYASASSASSGGDMLFYACAFLGLVGGMLSLAGLLAIGGEIANRLTFRNREHLDEFAELSPSQPKLKLDARGQAMQRTAMIVKPLSNFIYRTMQVGVLLIAAGTILGGVWADYSWGRFWGWDPKEVWALTTLLVYLIPLHGRFAGWISSFNLVVASVVCFLSVVMAWYGVNFVLGVGLHSYGFVEGGSQGIMTVILTAIMGLPLAAAWRRRLGQRSEVAKVKYDQNGQDHPGDLAAASTNGSATANGSSVKSRGREGKIGAAR
jgi:ABC-type transport system involved in cytochrome c biogenesis permease subunit